MTGFIASAVIYILPKRDEPKTTTTLANVFVFQTFKRLPSFNQLKLINSFRFAISSRYEP